MKKKSKKHTPDQIELALVAARTQVIRDDHQFEISADITRRIVVACKGCMYRTTFTQAWEPVDIQDLSDLWEKHRHEIYEAMYG